MGRKNGLKTKLLRKIRKSIYLTRVKMYDATFIKLNNDIMPSASKEFLLTDMTLASKILRETRLECAREILKREPRKKKNKIDRIDL